MKKIVTLLALPLFLAACQASVLEDTTPPAEEPVMEAPTADETMPVDEVIVDAAMEEKIEVQADPNDPAMAEDTEAAAE